MAMIKCPECGQDVSDSAETCPHCGYKLKKVDGESGKPPKKSRGKGCLVAAIIVVAIVVLGFVGCMVWAGSNSHSGSQTASSSQSSSNDSAAAAQLSLVGAWQPATGKYDPSDRLVPLWQDRSLKGAAKKKMLLDYQKDSDDVTLFVALSLSPDPSRDLEVGGDASLHVVGETADDQHDVYDLNKNDEMVNSKPLDMGYHEAIDASTVHSDGKKPYRLITLFYVDKKVMKRAKTFELTWDDYTVKFKKADISKVETPSQMVKELKKKGKQG